MASFHQSLQVVENLSIPVIVLTVICMVRLGILIVRYRGIQRLLKWQKILLQRGKPTNASISTPSRTFSSFMGELMPNILSANGSIFISFYTKLRQYHPLFGLVLDSAEGIRLTLVLWGQVLFVYLFGILFVDAFFHRTSLYNTCAQRMDAKSCEWSDPQRGSLGWMTLCEWNSHQSKCRHSFYFHPENTQIQQQAMAIVVTLAFCVTCAAVICTQFLLQHPTRCISLAYRIDFATTSEKPVHDATRTTTMTTTPSLHDFNDELRGACGDRRPVLPPLPPNKRRLLKLTHENTILPLPLHDARRRIFLLAARHRQLRQMYDDVPTGRLLTSLLRLPPTVTPFPQRPFSHTSEVHHGWNALRTSADVWLFQHHLQASAFNPRALQALFETCRRYATDTIYRKLRVAEDLTQELHYLCQHLPTPCSAEAKMMLMSSSSSSSSSSLVRSFPTFDRDLFLLKTFCVLWMPGLQSVLLAQTLLEEEREALYYLDDALRATLGFERVWQTCVLRPLLCCYRSVLRPDNAELTRSEAARAAFRTTRLLYTLSLALLYLLLLPAATFYLFHSMTGGRSTMSATGDDRDDGEEDVVVRGSLLRLWQCVCLVAVAQYYAVVLPLRVALLDVALPRLWLRRDFLELHGVLRARLPHVLRRRTRIVLDTTVSPTQPRFLSNQSSSTTTTTATTRIRETGSYLQAFHPICRVCRQTDILRAFPIAHFFLALSDRDLSVPSHHRPVLDALEATRWRDAPRHIELKRLETSTTAIDDALTRQSSLVVDAATMCYRDVYAHARRLASTLTHVAVVAFDVALTSLLRVVCPERQVRACVFDLAVATVVLGYVQLAALAILLRYQRRRLPGGSGATAYTTLLLLVGVWAPIVVAVVLGVLVPRVYRVWRRVVWDAGYEDVMPAPSRTRARHRAAMRTVHVDESRMLGIDLLGDLPAVVEVTEAEVEAEAYLRDRARRLGQPLDAVRRDLTRKKKQRMRQMKQTTTATIAYTNRGQEARAQRTLRWYRAWEHGRVHRVLQCVGLSVFSFLAPWHGERIRAGQDLARVAVLAEEPDHQQPQSQQPQASSSLSIEWMEGMDHATAGAEGKYHDDDNDDELDADYHHPRMAKRFSPSSKIDLRYHEPKSKRPQQSQHQQRQQHHRHSPWMQGGGGGEASTTTAQEDSTYAPPDYDGDFSDMDDDSMV